MRTKHEQVLGAAGVFTASIQLGNRCWYIHRATGNLTLKLKLQGGSSFEITRTAGFRADEGMPIESFQVASDVDDDDIDIWFSDTIEWEQPVLGPGGVLPVQVVLPGTLSVEGTANPAEQFANADLPKQIGVFMTRNNGDGTTTTYPLTTFDGRRLLTGYQDEALGFAIAIDVPVSVQQFATGRMSVFTGGASDAQLLDDLGLPLGYYEDDGTFHGDGIIPAGTAAGTVFYLPLTAVLSFSVTSAANTWSFNLRLSQNVFAPPAP